MPTTIALAEEVHDRLRHLPIPLQGSPFTSYLDVGAGGGGWPVQAWDRGKYVSAMQDPTTGAVTLGSPTTRRTPWYTQTDFNLQQNYKVSENKIITFTATFSNLLNQRAITAYNADITSLNVGNQYIALQWGQWELRLRIPVLHRRWWGLLCGGGTAV